MQRRFESWFRVLCHSCLPPHKQASKVSARGSIWRYLDLRDGEVRAEAFIAEGHQPR